MTKFKPPKAIAHIGDTHLFHDLVTIERGYTLPDGSPDHARHVADVIDSIRATVPKRAILHLYGDLSVASGAEKMLFTFHRLIEERRYRTRLWLGNHDKPHPLNGNVRPHLLAYLGVFDEVSTLGQRSVDGTTTYQSHFPAAGAGDHHGHPERHTAYRVPSEAIGPDAWLVHAHTHQEGTPTVPERPHHICVSWDVAHRPLLDGDLARIIKNEPMANTRKWVRDPQTGVIPALEEWRKHNEPWEVLEL